MRLRLSGAMNLFGAMLAGGLLVLAGVSWYAVQTVRVGGPLYEKVIEEKDLTADILPPPLYVIDAYLDAKLAFAAAGSTDLQAAEKEFAKHRAEYEVRLAHWQAIDFDPEVKSVLMGESNTQVQTVWTSADAMFKALSSGDTASAAAHEAQMTQAFEAHRAAVEAVVPVIAADQAKIEAAASTEEVKLLSLMGAVCLLLGGIIVGGVWAISRGVVRPVQAITSYMGQLAAGDYERSVPFAGRHDELGDMAKSVAVFREGVLERRALRQEQDQERRQSEVERQSNEDTRLQAEQKRDAAIDSLAQALDHLSAGNVAYRLETAFAPEYEKLRGDFNAAASKLTASLGQIRQASSGVGSGASEIAQAADDLSRRTEQQAASLEQTAAALDEITSTVRQTADGARKANEIVVDTRRRATATEQAVGAAVRAVGEIESSSAQISQIIGVIDEIAFQTNLLALNAGVEAARAGEAGRGFAVVAQEVRALAQRSADAAKQIKVLISTASTKVSEGVGLVGQTGTALNDIMERVSQIAALVAEISASSQEQSTGLNEVNTAINQMDQMTQQNAAMVEQTTAAAHSMRGESGRLTQMVDQFNLEPATRTRRAAA
ncbi:methyl-accepting chemotaxis protein [Caulobacter sp. ErkDOM-YI]|uniref:methyl-accepting chemotaxis protein n=1 Tax=unclassified Caulobacter TaxID=2648921 RepID=UPI003AF9308E